MMPQKMVATLLILSVAVGLTACVSNPDAGSEPIPEIRPGILQGYLAGSEYPNSLVILPPPPAQDSIAHSHDGAISERSLTLQGSPRWLLAAEDNELMFPAAADTFSCALDAPITQADTPSLYRLMRRVLPDAGLSTYTAKNHYQRTRPFMVNGQQTCLSEVGQQQLEKDGSYPSGHSAVGWAWALILAELAPDRADTILARGRAFGQSRVVCNVHWQSDVQEGQFMGAAAVARLHANAVFQADMAAAAAELAAVRAQSLPPARDCAAETGALGQLPADAVWPMK
jgi:acid phosphatase (class A)